MASVADTSPAALPAIPDGWIPDDAVISAVARKKADGRWEVVVPRYAVVSQGSNADEAFHQAGELLADYFRVCVRDGRSFDECRRPIDARWTAELVTAALLASVARRVPRVPWHRSSTRLLRVPANHAFC